MSQVIIFHDGHTDSILSIYSIAKYLPSRSKVILIGGDHDPYVKYKISCAVKDILLTRYSTLNIEVLMGLGSEEIWFEKYLSIKDPHHKPQPFNFETLFYSVLHSSAIYVLKVPTELNVLSERLKISKVTFPTTACFMSAGDYFIRLDQDLEKRNEKLTGIFRLFPSKLVWVDPMTVLGIHHLNVRINNLFQFQDTVFYKFFVHIMYGMNCSIRDVALQQISELSKEIAETSPSFEILKRLHFFTSVWNTVKDVEDMLFPINNLITFYSSFLDVTDNSLFVQCRFNCYQPNNQATFYALENGEQTNFYVMKHSLSVKSYVLSTAVLS